MMRCQKCHGELRVTHTYAVSNYAKTATLACLECGRKYTLYSEILGEASGYGQGAAAEATRRRESTRSPRRP